MSKSPCFVSESKPEQERQGQDEKKSHRATTSTSTRNAIYNVLHNPSSFLPSHNNPTLQLQVRDKQAREAPIATSICIALSHCVIIFGCC